MASGSALIALLDDIATMVKITSKKTSAVLEKKNLIQKDVSDFDFSTVYKIGKGSLKNKAMIIPVVIGINAIAPAAIVPLLVGVGVYFCYEGIKKINYKKTKNEDIGSCEESLRKLERLKAKKMKEALRTDMVISAEIIAVSMLAVSTTSLFTQFIALASIGVATTVGVYSIVGGIVNMRAFGERLKNNKNKGIIGKSKKKLGVGIVKAKPKIIKTISVLGTISIFIVGGMLIMHGVPVFAQAVSGFASAVTTSPLAYSLVKIASVVTGAVAVGVAATGAKYATKFGLNKINEIGKKRLPLFFNRKTSKKLLTAVEVGNRKEAKKLLKQGASLNITNWNGETPLMRAVWFGDKELVKIFLKAGANPKKCSNGQVNSIDIAKRNKNTEIVKLLKKNK